MRAFKHVLALTVTKVGLDNFNLSNRFLILRWIYTVSVFRTFSSVFLRFCFSLTKYALFHPHFYVPISAPTRQSHTEQKFSEKKIFKGVQLYFEILLLSFIHKIFEQNFYLYITVYLVRIWTVTYKNADEKAHTFSRRSKNVKKRTKTYEKRILCKFTFSNVIFSMAIKSSKFDPKNGVEMAIFPNIIKISYVLRRLADAATRDLIVGVHALTVIDICFTKARSSAFARRQYGDRFGNSTIQTSHCQSQLVLIELIEQQRWSRGHKARGQGQGQGHKKNPRPRPRTAFPRTGTLEAKDRNARGQGPRTQSQVLSKKKKKKVFTKIFQAISKKKSLHKHFSGDLQKKKRSSQKFFKRSPLKNVFQKIFQPLHKILTFQKIVLSSSRGQANFRGLEASRPRPRTWPSRPRPRPRTSKRVLEDSTSVEQYSISICSIYIRYKE